MEPDDLCYLAQYENSIGRNEQAISFLEEFAAKKPNFNQKERQLLVLIFKNAVDPIRETIRSLLVHEKNILDAQNANCAQMIKHNINISLKQLRDLCQKGLNLVEKVLIPACTESEGIAFYEKLNGDLYRYQTEFSEGEEQEAIKKGAKEAYEKALTAAQELSPAHPTRLGIILNYAVFKYEHVNEKEDAKVMVTTAITESATEMDKLSESLKAESLSVIDVMQKNLHAWSNQTYSDVDEEDEEEADPDQ